MVRHLIPIVLGLAVLGAGPFTGPRLVELATAVLESIGSDTKILPGTADE